MTMPTNPWSPSHRVPQEGLPAWSEPSPTASPAQPLGGGLDVMVLQWRADWAQVRCANGWETWVDGRRLVPLAGNTSPPEARRSNTSLLVLAGLAVVAVAVALLVFSGGDDDPAPVAQTSDAHGVRLQVPEGWAVSADGLSAAARRADLTGDVPSGPRVRALPTTAGAGADDLLREPTAADQPTAEIVEEADTVEIAGRRMVAITLREQVGATALVRRYLGGPSPTNAPVLFVLEAPADQYQQHAAVLAGIPGWGPAR